MDDLYKLKYLDFVEKGEDIWFPNLYFNALIKINKNSGEVEIIGKFPNYNVEEKWLYIAICMIGDNLIFVPHGSQEIVSYDMKTGKFTSIALDLNVVGKTWGYFLSAYAYKNFVYMFPAYTRYIVRFDTRNNSIIYFDLGLSTALRNLPKTAVCFVKEFVVIEHKVYIPFAMLNAIAVFDLEEEQLEIKYLNIIGGCSTINYIDGYFYLASCKEHQIYSWKEKTGEIIVFDNFPGEFLSKNYMFSSSYIVGNKIFFMPLESNMIISLNLQTKEIGCEKEIINENKEYWNTYFVKRKDDKIISMTADAPMLCLLEYENKNLKYIPYYICNDLFNKRKIRNFFRENMCFGIMWEWEMTLEKYIEIWVKSDASIYNNESKKFGKNIFEQIWMKGK